MKKLICLVAFVLVVIHGVSNAGSKTINANHARNVAVLESI